MIELLNEDSWALILQYVEMKDQLSLMHVSENMKHIVQNNWKCIKEAHMDIYILKLFKKEPHQMHNFLKFASGSLERLLLRGPFIDVLLPSWKGYEFPNLRSLDCHLWHTEMNDDKVTLLLSKLFPHITKLNLNSTSHGHYIWNFNQLQELSLASSSLDTSTLDKLFSSLPLRKLSLFPFCTSHVGELSLIWKCGTLEELLIHDYNLTFEMLSSLMKLPRFQRLSFYTRDYCENYTRNLQQLHQESRIQSMVFNSIAWYFYNVGLCIADFSNLRRLVIQSDDIDRKQLYTICSKLQHLEELHLIDIRDFPFATDMWNMVGACKTLKVLNISNNKLNKYFLEVSSTCLNRVLKRSNLESPVTLYVHNTILANNTQETLDALNHPYLRVSFNPVHIHTLANSNSPFIETEFRALT